MKIITWLVPFFVIVWPLRAQEPPKISTTQEGVVHRHEVEGHLASTRSLGCIALSEAKSSFTPPDLYGAVRACIDRDDYDASVALFALAGIYSRFDVERVADKTAEQGIPVLIMNAFSHLSPDKKERFNAALQRVTGTPALRDTLCGTIRSIGMPDYYPNYLILHGIKAFMGTPPPADLVVDFDRQQVWESLQSTYLNCLSR
ncbi:MAG: hypothetical protein H7836_09940 [Magnetococcus sp. YQC-3]